MRLELDFDFFALVFAPFAFDEDDLVVAFVSLELSCFFALPVVFRPFCFPLPRVFLSLALAFSIIWSNSSREEDDSLGALTDVPCDSSDVEEDSETENASSLVAPGFGALGREALEVFFLFEAGSAVLAGWGDLTDRLDAFLGDADAALEDIVALGDFGLDASSDVDDGF